MTEFEVRKAVEADIRGIYLLLKIYSDKQIVLPRDEENLRFYLKNFFVVYRGKELCGCCAMRDFGGRLFEVRSLAVHPACQRGGIGRALVQACIRQLEESGEKARLFVLTYQREFFNRLGFTVTDKRNFPEKIWSDCAFCPKREHCDEIAMQKEILP